MRRILLSLLLLFYLPAAHADGGRLRLHEPAGPFVVTLFTSPDPLTTGQADFSVAIERRDTPGIVQDVNVTLVLTPEDGASERLILDASHSGASSRFLQAANFSLPRSGIWNVTVVAQQGADVGRCSGLIDVLPARLPGDEMTGEIAIVPILVLLFGIHQWRKRVFQSRN